MQATDRHESEPIVISGIGMVSSLGSDRESTWQGLCAGRSGVRRLAGIESIPDGLLLGAPAAAPPVGSNQLKVIHLANLATNEALSDGCITRSQIDPYRLGCAVSAHIGDTTQFHDPLGQAPTTATVAWWDQFLPNAGCHRVAQRAGSLGPRIAHSVACASGLIDVLTAVRWIKDGQCDIAICGSAEAIDPLFAAGFYQMKVLARHDDPVQAIRPFDRHRTGFVMGEGAAMFVVERLSHAIRRGARIYAEIVAGKMLAEAHHVTGLDEQGEAVTYLIRAALHQAGIQPEQVGYINAHGTGTEQNDLVESRGIRRAFGSAADKVWVSASKSMIGHLVNASGSVELGIAALTLRDDFAPPTLNLTDPDPECEIDGIPLVGRRKRFEYVMKLSLAFGGHLAAVILRRWDDPANNRPSQPVAA